MRRPGRQRHVAGEREAEPRAGGRTVDENDQWFFHPHEARDCLMQRARQFAQEGGNVVGRLGESGNVTAATEQPSTSGENDAADCLVFIAAGGRIDKSARKRHVDRIADRRTIEDQRRDRTLDRHCQRCAHGLDSRARTPTSYEGMTSRWNRSSYRTTSSALVIWAPSGSRHRGG
jgi:hypothetical protein